MRRKRGLSAKAWFYSQSFHAREREKEAEYLAQQYSVPCDRCKHAHDGPCPVEDCNCEENVFVEAF